MKKSIEHHIAKKICSLPLVVPTVGLYAHCHWWCPPCLVRRYRVVLVCSRINSKEKKKHPHTGHSPGTSEAEGAPYRYRCRACAWLRKQLCTRVSVLHISACGPLRHEARVRRAHISGQSLAHCRARGTIEACFRSISRQSDSQSRAQPPCPVEGQHLVVKGAQPFSSS